MVSIDKNILNYLKGFATHPLKAMRLDPAWPVEDIKTTFFVLVMVSVVSGFVTGLVSKSILVLIGSVFFFPISGIVLSLSLAVLFYILFVVFQEKILDLYGEEIDFVNLHRVVVLAILPYQALRVFMGFDVLRFWVEIIAIIFTAFLLVEGFTTHLKLPRKGVWNATMACCLFILFFKIIPPLFDRDQRPDEEARIPQESLEILEEQIAD